MRIRFVPSHGCQAVFRPFLMILILSISVGTAAVSGFAADSFDQNSQESTKKLLKLAKRQMRKGLLGASVESIKKVLSREPDNADAALQLAYVYLKQKRPSEAFELAYPIARDDPKNAFAFAIVGTYYLQAGSFKEARILLSNAVILNKREALGWASLGLLEFYENDLMESILNLEQAVYLDYREADYHFSLGQVAARGERYKRSAEAYEKFLRIAPKSDKERRDRIRGLIKFLNYLGKRASLYDLAGADRTSVRMRVVNNRPIVQVRFDKDGEPLNFVLDTGSGMTVISEETARRFKVKKVARGGLARAIGGDGKFEIVYGFLNTIRIGDVKIRNVPTYIRKFPESGTKVDGYIGISLISKYVATLDYGKNTFTLIKKDLFDPSAEQPGGRSIPLRLTSSGFLSGNVTMSGVESDYHFILDTGASVSVVDNELAAREEVLQHKTGQRMRVIGAAGITENVPMFLLKGVSFGGIAVPDLSAVALDLDVINETAGFEQAGIIGGNFLRDYSLTFDFRRSKVIFVPN